MNKKKIFIILLIALLILIPTAFIIYTYSTLGRGGYNPGFQYINNTVEVDGLNITITDAKYYDDSTTIYITFENTTSSEKEIYIHLKNYANGNLIDEYVDVENILIDNENTKIINPKTTSYAVVNINHCLKPNENSYALINICKVNFYLNNVENK